MTGAGFVAGAASDSTRSAAEPSGHPEQPRPAGVPLGVAPAARVGAVLAIAVIAVGAFGVRDAVVGLQWAPGRPWIPLAADVLDGQRPTWWTGLAGIAIGVLGVVLVAIAVLPRRRMGLPVAADTAVYVGHDDVAVMAAAVVRDVPGVLRVRASCTPGRVRVRCVVTAEDRSDVEAAVRTALTTELAVLQAIPRIVVRTRTETRT